MTARENPDQFKPHIQGCTGKKAFATKKQAEARARRMRKKYTEPLAEYRCEHCRRWHIGGTE